MSPARRGNAARPQSRTPGVTAGRPRGEATGIGTASRPAMTHSHHALTRRRALLAAALAILPLLPPGPARAAAEKVNAEGGLAIRGYDPVAYHVEGRPQRGRPEFSHQWNGASWRFASAANRDRFAADPARYAPAYGGFCAYAVSEGYTAPIDPDAWRIVDGRLYLNYNRSIQRRWAEDIPGRIARADAHWPRLREVPN